MAARFRLQELLDERGLTQSELSRRSGVSLTTINRMCKNITGQVSLRTLDSLASVLQVEPGTIIASVPAKRRRSRA